MPRRRSRQKQKNFGVYMKSKEKRVSTAACGSAVRHAARRQKDVMRKLEIHDLSVQTLVKAFR